MISVDTLRYQKTLNTLYRSGAMSLLETNRHKYVLEIGGGYGALAHHLSSLCKNTTYFTIDLPETLLFSAPFVAIHNPDKKIYLYDPGDFSEIARSAQGFSDYDFVFVPNYKLEDLSALRFDLVLNQASLAEMTTAQVQEYIDVVRATCVGYFYTHNQDRFVENVVLNTELGSLTPDAGSRV